MAEESADTAGGAAGVGAELSAGEGAAATKDTSSVAVSVKVPRRMDSCAVVRSGTTGAGAIGVDCAAGAGAAGGGMRSARAGSWRAIMSG